MSFFQPEMPSGAGQGQNMQPPTPVSPAQPPQGRKPGNKPRLPSFMGSIGTDMQSNAGGKSLMGQ